MHATILLIKEDLKGKRPLTIQFLVANQTDETMNLLLILMLVTDLVVTGVKGMTRYSSVSTCSWLLQGPVSMKYI